MASVPVKETTGGLPASAGLASCWPSVMGALSVAYLTLVFGVYLCMCV